MKKLTLLLGMLVVACLAFAQLRVQAVMGMDTSGNHEISVNSDSQDFDVKTGYSPSIEAFAVNGNVLYGVGAEYQLDREIDLEDNYYDKEEGLSPKFGFTPIYALVKLQLPLAQAFKIEALGHVGYNLFRYNDDYAEDGEYSEGSYYGSVKCKAEGGLYYAYGAGVVLGEKIVVQMLVKTNKASMDVNYEYGDSSYYESYKYNMDIVNEQVQFSAGLRF